LTAPSSWIRTSSAAASDRNARSGQRPTCGSRAAARRLRTLLDSVPEVRTVVSRVGRPDDGTDPKVFSSAEFYVDFKPEREWRHSKSKEELIAEMDRAISVLPGIETSFSQPIRDNVLESISQVDGQVVIKLHGEDRLKLMQLATATLAAIRNVPGVIAPSSTGSETHRRS
jgi:cobalt-zinc-cadmium resistance protein CzcA